MILAHTSTYSPTILRAQSNWRFAKSEDFQHGVYRMVMLEDGIHEVETKSDQGVYQRGDIYLIKPEEYHAIQASPNSLAALLVFTVMQTKMTYKKKSFSLPKNHRQPSPIKIWGVDLPTKLDNALATRLHGIFRLTLSLLWQTEWEHYQANHRLAAMLDRIANFYRSDSSSKPKATSTDDPWLQQVDQLINHGVAHFKNVTDLADCMNLSPGYFAKKFKAMRGVSAAAYLRHKRMEEARRLLLQADWPIHLVAAHLNYPSLSTFTQTWKRTYGISPSEFKNEMQS